MAQSQQITEVIYSMRKSYSGFFTGKKSSMTIEFHRKFNNPMTAINAYPAGDTTLQAFIQVNNENYETESVSSGIALFGVGSILGSSASASKTEKLIRQKGLAILNREQLNKLFLGLNSTFTYIKTKEMNSGSRTTVFAAYEDEVLKFGGEYSPNAVVNKITYYIQFDDAIFKMQEAEFAEILKFIKTIRDSWPSPGA